MKEGKALAEVSDMWEPKPPAITNPVTSRDTILVDMDGSAGNDPNELDQPGNILTISIDRGLKTYSPFFFV